MKVIAEVNHEDVRNRAQEVLNDMDKYEGHILKWMVAGPFTIKGQDGEAVYAAKFAPEEPHSKDVAWKELTSGIGSWDINLESTFGGMDHCAAYLRTPRLVAQRSGSDAGNG